MDVQYVTDSTGTTKGVFVPIEDWEALKSKYNVVEAENIIEQPNYPIPEEHKQIVRERIEKYKNNPDSYLTLDELEDSLNFD